MARLLNLTAATVLAAVAGTATAEVEPTRCIMDVSRDRDARELSCQLQHGPKSGTWDPRFTPQLDACLEQVQFRWKVLRWQCDGVTLRGVDYEKL